MSLATALGFRGRPDARQDARTRVYLKATLLANGRPMPIHILDLSRKGALVHADDPPDPGEIVWVVCKGNELLGRTAWVKGSRFGLAFDSGIPSARLDILLTEGRRALASAEPMGFR
ncbi:PilZ domain-containing protein [Rhizorhabdus sp. FW153]|uniref:PilZ domain-containing protein n=1 Tax=Rhizorhabdus sp. FW153 TaxID=3400216 RepID=UPI003CF6B989